MVVKRNKRAIVYIDGFNFYNGLVHKRWEKYKWLDFYVYALRIIPKNHDLQFVRFFTSTIRGDAEKYKRQQIYINALMAQNGKNILIEYGNFQSFKTHCKSCGQKPVFCATCGSEYIKRNEKKTDVNLSTSLFIDCIENKTDCITLVSGDSDYTAPLREIKRLFPHVFRYIVFPPKRRNPALLNYCDDCYDTQEDILINSLLPDPVINSKTGKKYYKPTSWI